MIVGLGWLASVAIASRLRAFVEGYGPLQREVTSTSSQRGRLRPPKRALVSIQPQPGPSPETSRRPEPNLRMGMLGASVVVGSPHGEPPEPNARAIGPGRSGGDYAVAESGSASSFLSFAIAGSLLVICRVSAVCIRGSSA
jgi:hypothetical protein